MKKILALTFTLIMSFYISACGNAANNSGNVSSSLSANQSGASSSQHAVNAELNNAKNQIKRDNAMSTASSDIRIKMTFINEEVIVKIYDNPSSRTS